MWKGFTGRLNWSWSHANDDVSDGGLRSYGNYSIGGQIDPTCLRCLNYASADYDIRFYLSASYVWNLPFHSRNGFLRALTKRMDALSDILPPHGLSLQHHRLSHRLKSVCKQCYREHSRLSFQCRALAYRLRWTPGEGRPDHTMLHAGLVPACWRRTRLRWYWSPSTC